MSFLSIQALSQQIQKKQILDSIDLCAQRGTIVSILGPNGAGKTTLLKTIIGLLPAPKPNNTHKKNTIVLDNHVINNWPIHKKVQAGLIYLPQQTSLFQQMTVTQNLQLVYEYQDDWQKKKLSEFIEQRDHWLKQTDLLHAHAQIAGTLSGGQKRKLEIVRSLLMNPKLIMLDEPFAGVDPKSIYELKSIFTTMATRDNIGIIISDHNVDQLLSIATSVYVILNGHVVTSGSIKDILESNHTKESYLGDQFYQEISKRYLGSASS